MSVFSKKNIGWVLTGLLSGLLFFSAARKLMGNDHITQLLGSGNLTDWVFIIGIGELVSAILFIIPKTMRLGTVLLSAYFGGAILFHMGHTDPASQTFSSPAMILVFIWITSWVRGNELVSLK